MHSSNYWREKIEKAFEYAMERNSFSKVSIVEQAEHVCVFGLGKYFEDAFFRQKVRERFGVNCLCDNNQAKIDELKQDIRLTDMSFFRPEDLGKLDNIVVILMLGDPRSAIEQLAPIIGKENCITYNDLALDDTMNAKKELKYYYDQRMRLFQAFELLKDEKSQQVFANIFCLRVAPHLADYTYEKLYSSDQYFSQDIINLSEHESVVDCGAYDGDTFENFNQLTGSKFDKYFAFEIDKNNFLKLQEKAELIAKDKIVCYPFGVWSENKLLSYGTMSSSDSYSIFNEKETELAKVVKLDDILKDQTVSLIKMDIEGAEMEALRGGQWLIQNQHPIMAICVYHRIEDLWEIPLYLKSLYPQYKIYIRHHAKFYVSETVCYAIPVREN